MASDGRLALSALFLGMGLFGVMATDGQLFAGPLGKLLRQIARGSSEAVTLIGGPTPFKYTYTGIGFVDAVISHWTAFVAALVDDPELRWNTWALYIESMGQFCVGWGLLLLECRRAGNRGLAVSWAGTLGVVFQAISWAFSLPLYFGLHLLTSPISKLDGKGGKITGESARKLLFVDLWDLALMPISLTLGTLIPTLFMSLPSLFSSIGHYSWIAFWIPFGPWTVIAMDLFKSVASSAVGTLGPKDSDGKPTTAGKGFYVAVSTLRVFLLGHHFHQDVAAAPFLGQPAIDPVANGPGRFGPLVADFYLFDLYLGNGAMLLWALYLYLKQTGSSPAKAVQKAAVWSFLGGFVAGAFALLWERDELVQEGENEAKRK
ncbi:hypothetical protein Daesc_005096 [Daldinia eschscholtzii]|uniref:Uncharacterized protein n=1 Tax=Daldinia eschscholtzii TaxID=292717 RepID=A0AAX6MKU7_9PEZI